MGLFKKLIDSLYEAEPKSEEGSSLDRIYKEQSTSKKDKPKSLASRFIDSLYEEPDKSKPSRNKPSFISGLIDSLYEGTSEFDFTDSEDVESTLEGVIGKIKGYKKQLDMLSIAVNNINKDSFPRAKEVIEGYLRLAVRFQQELEPYINSNINNLPASTYLKIQTALGEFEMEFQGKIPEVKTLAWLTQMVNVNRSMKGIFNSGTLRDIAPSEIQRHYDYVDTIAAQKDTFVGYKSELIHELLISEYRLTMLSLMRKIGSGENVSRSPFAGLDPKKIHEFEQLFMEDYDASSEQFKYIMALKKKALATGKFSEGVFDELSALVDSFDEKLGRFMLDDYAITEIFSDNPEYFNSLKLFIRIKLAMNTMSIKCREAIEEEEIWGR